jgi:hypothetical protein
MSDVRIDQLESALRTIQLHAHGGALLGGVSAYEACLSIEVMVKKALMGLPLRARTFRHLDPGETTWDELADDLLKALDEQGMAVVPKVTWPENWTESAKKNYPPGYEPLISKE